MITDLQKHTVHAIVNIFETGKILGNYGQVTLLAGDSGHLTYGRSQTTLASGNLFLLIKAYCGTDDSECSAALTPYLDRLEDHDLSLDHDTDFRTLRRKAGDDPVMHEVQDSFFDRVYWEPAVKSAEYIKSTTALGMAIVYDSRIHGSWHRIRDGVIADFGRLQDKGEEAWMKAYIAARHNWLSTHSNKLLRKTAYRMDALNVLCDAGQRSLNLPISVRGHTIDEAALSGPPLRVSAAVTEQPILRLRNPMMEGPDVKALQEALKEDADGVFGPGTKAAVIKFQKSKGLTADGIVGPSTRSHLDLDL